MFWSFYCLPRGIQSLYHSLAEHCICKREKHKNLNHIIPVVWSTEQLNCLKHLGELEPVVLIALKCKLLIHLIQNYLSLFIKDADWSIFSKMLAFTISSSRFIGKMETSGCLDSNIYRSEKLLILTL